MAFAADAPPPLELIRSDAISSATLSAFEQQGLDESPTILGFLSSLPSAALGELYNDTYTCLTIFRSVMHHFALFEVVCSDHPFSNGAAAGFLVGYALFGLVGLFLVWPSNTSCVSHSHRQTNGSRFESLTDGLLLISVLYICNLSQGTAHLRAVSHALLVSKLNGRTHSQTSRAAHCVRLG